MSHSQDSTNSTGSEKYNFCTPQNKLIRSLIDSQHSQHTPNNSQCHSPFGPLRIPASPAMTRLGYGTGVGVYLLERSPRPSGEVRSPWAIKKLTKMKNRDNSLLKMRLDYETKILKGLKHPNIIGFRTAGKAFLAMESASKSLSDLIELRVEELTPFESVQPFSADRIERVAQGIGRALQYLHDVVKFIHGDLKAANVLVFGDFETVKLCDFGVARKLKEDGTIDGRYVGTEIWNPMEVLLTNRGEKGKHAITSKADIYPFGLTLFEMMSLKPPHFSAAEEDYEAYASQDSQDSSIASMESEDEISFDEEKFDKALQKQLGRRPPLPDFDFDESYSKILGIFYCCTEQEQEKRPKASEILTMLEAEEGKEDNDNAIVVLTKTTIENEENDKVI